MDLPPDKSILSMAEEETVLPCRYQPETGQTVVQVTWNKEKPDGTEEQIITAHHINGQTGWLALWPNSSGVLSAEKSFFSHSITSPFLTHSYMLIPLSKLSIGIRS